MDSGWSWIVVFVVVAFHNTIQQRLPFIVL
jgi:hypothetical protein